MMVRPKAFSVTVRSLLTWVLVAALVCAAALSLHVHATHAGDHSGAPAVDVVGTACDHEPGSDGDHERHCSCQHFGGIAVPAVVLASHADAAEHIVSSLPPRITHPPAAPHRPPIA